jgi:hypothetical protein
MGKRLAMPQDEMKSGTKAAAVITKSRRFFFDFDQF